MKHAAIIPLAGGAAIGASLALKTDPEYLASWGAFEKNDAYAQGYFNKVPMYNYDIRNTWKLPKVNLITCVPPCSGLSTSTPSHNRGCSAPQNQHMLAVAKAGMEQGTQMILIENAPTLYSPGGEEFAVRFKPLLARYEYSMVLLKTSTILHGLPQNRVRSFIMLYRGNRIPEFNYINKSYPPLMSMPLVKGGKQHNEWYPEDDEVVQLLLKHFGCGHSMKKLIKGLALEYNNKPVTGWKVFMDHKIKIRFKTEPYRYMQRTQESGAGIMDRSPYFVSDYTNALMWKSVGKMINPADPDRIFNIRELMNMMGMPNDYVEIPAKHINILFQNVPVTTVKTLVTEMKDALDGKRKWYKPDVDRSLGFTRINNIKQCVEN